jgi:hypothetical protein
MPQHAPLSMERRHEPTMLETQLDSICLKLTNMKMRLYHMPLLEHMSDAERDQLAAALARAEARLFEVSAIIRGNA